MTSPSDPFSASGPSRRGFWEHPAFIAALILAAALPLAGPDIAPLTDLPGHMGRYRVQLDLAGSAALQRFYDFEWALIGNLGIDLLVIPLSKLFGLELAVKLIILAIPPLTVAGFLWVAREVHGRVPPTALFALPFAYSYPFLFGFANFALSMAFAFLAFGLWLRLARLGRLRLRAAIFVPLSGLIWVTHTFGWGTLGVMAFAAELVRQHDRGQRWTTAAPRAAFHCLALAPPALLMLLWRSGHVGGQTADWFNLSTKFYWLLMVLRDRWAMFDVASSGLVVLMIVWAVRSPRIGFSRNLAASAIFLTLVFLLLPRIVFGSNYADMRLAPYLVAVAILAIRPREEAGARLIRFVAVAGLAFFLLRTGATTASFRLYDRSFDRELAALDHVPQGARLLSFVGRECRPSWRTSRFDHLPGMAIVRRNAFSNDQWTMAGAQLLSVDYPEGGGFVRDPSQLVVPLGCDMTVWRTVDQALRRFPRAGFDYVWLIDPPPYDPALTAGLRPIWRQGSSVLFEVER